MSNFNIQPQEATMTWSIANAKQQFSEVVRLTAEQPQAIYNREKPVAVLISAQDYEDFQRWRAERDRPSLAQQFDALRTLLDAENLDGIEIAPRSNRPNPMDEPGYWD